MRGSRQRPYFPILTASTYFSSDYFVNPCQSVSYPVKIHQKDSDKKSPGIVEIPGLFEYSRDRSALAEFLNLFEGRQALPKTPGKTEMVLRFPLSFP